jgi:hypothetical protein
MTVQNHLTTTEVSSGLIQFHFGLKGSANLFSIKELSFEMKEKSLLLYNPQKELP